MNPDPTDEFLDALISDWRHDRLIYGITSLADTILDQLLAERQQMQQQLQTKEKENRRLREALGVYARRDHDHLFDMGKVACQALEEADA